MKVAIACGGTGGHTFPGIATGLVLKTRGHETTLWLAGKTMEHSATTAWNGPTVTVAATGLPFGFSIKSLVCALKLLAAVFKCRSIMRKNPPDVLLAMGSYASVGPVLAARSLGIPVVLHEANVIPGRATKFLRRFANSVATAFAETKQRLQNTDLVLTGMPIMENRGLFSNEKLTGICPEAFTLLITGGSGGASRLNEIASEAVCKLHLNGATIQVIHLTGKKDEPAVRAKYKEAGVTAFVSGFFGNMDMVYARSDLAVCRAGASTCAELRRHAVPALLVPFPYAANKHQSANAMAMEKTGGFDVVEEKNLNTSRLCDYILKLINNPAKLDQNKTAAGQGATVDAAGALADLVEKAGKFD